MIGFLLFLLSWRLEKSINSSFQIHVGLKIQIYTLKPVLNDNILLSYNFSACKGDIGVPTLQRSLLNFEL